MAFWCQPTDFEEECKWRGKKIQQFLSLKACGSPSTGHQQKQQQPLNKELAKHMSDTRSWLSELSTRVCPIACITRGYPAKRECRLSSADEGPGHWQAKGLVTGWFAPFSGWWHMESPSHLSLSPLSCLDLGQPWASSISAGGKSLCLGFCSASKLRQDAVGTSARATPHAARKSAETNPLSKSALVKDFEKATVTWRRLVVTTVHFSQYFKHTWKWWYITSREERGQNGN